MFHFKNNLNLNHLNKRLSSHRLFKMVNPYALNTRQPAKPQIQLGQSQALKKFEKFQAKYQASASGASQSNKFRKRNDDDDDDDDDEDDDSLFKNAKKTANKFMKKKQTEAIAQHGTDSESDSDQTFTESKHSEMSIGIEILITVAFVVDRQQAMWTEIAKVLDDTDCQLLIPKGWEPLVPPDYRRRTEYFGYQELKTMTPIVRRAILDGQIRHTGEVA